MRRTISIVMSGPTLIFVILTMLAQTVLASESASPNDQARLLAGMMPAETSPLAPHTRAASWQRHAKHFDAVWGQLDMRQLSKIRAWSGKNLPQQRPAVYYMFSGPDFLYADAFFPKAATYVLSGLEPVGHVTDLTALTPQALAREINELKGALNSVLSFSFFITKKMKTELNAGRVTGTLPILYVFLARSGKTIHEMSLVSLDSDGIVRPSGEAGARSNAASGVKIVFSGSEGNRQTLYYFSTDLSDGGVKNSGFLKFCEGFGAGDSLLKSASYLMHSDGFSKVRDFVLKQSDAIVQDDSGIPLRFFNTPAWELRPFGNYLGPISLFPRQYQPKLSELFRKQKAAAIDFGIGYRWRPRESNLLLAVKSRTKTAQGQ